MLSNDEKKEALENVLEIFKKDVTSIVILADFGNDFTMQVLGRKATTLGLLRMAEHDLINTYQ